MKTLHSFPLYLLLVCYLCLTTSQDTNFDQAFNHLVYLDTTYFQGPWQSAARDPVALFQKNYGFFASKVNKDCELPVASILTIYDGNNMEEFLEVNLCQSFSASFHFDQANASIIGTNVALNISNRGISAVFNTSLLKMIVCSSDVSIHFINKTSNTPMTSLKNINKWGGHQCRHPVYHIKLGMLNFCNNRCGDSRFGYDIVSAELNYNIPYVFLAVFGAIYAVTSDHHLSALSQCLRCAWAIFFLIYNISLCFPGGSLICIFSVLAGILEILCTLFLALVDYDKRYDRKTIKYLVILLPCLFITWKIAASYDIKWLFLSSSLYLVPQIIKTYKSGEVCKFEVNVISMFMLSQVYVAGYLWKNQQSFFQRIPNPTFFHVYFVLALTQWIIYMIQRKWPSLKRNKVERLD